jgi:hypothetical protein
MPGWGEPNKHLQHPIKGEKGPKPMKTLQHMPATFDRLSTHEELHQVLALVHECAPSLAGEAPSEPEEEMALRDAVADLWREAPADERDSKTHGETFGEEIDVSGELYRLAEMLTGKTERIN